MSLILALVACSPHENIDFDGVTVNITVGDQPPFQRNANLAKLRHTEPTTGDCEPSSALYVAFDQFVALQGLESGDNPTPGSATVPTSWAMWTDDAGGWDGFSAGGTFATVGTRYVLDFGPVTICTWSDPLTPVDGTCADVQSVNLSIDPGGEVDDQCGPPEGDCGVPWSDDPPGWAACAG